MTWVEVLTYPVVIITWVHFDLGGGADVLGVPSGHYYLGGGVDGANKNEKILIPHDLDYLNIKGLSNEVVERLIIHKPSTLGQATRLEGVTPAAINLIAITIKKNQLLERA